MLSKELIASSIIWVDRTGEREVDGRWVIEFKAFPAVYPAGTLVCEPAVGDDAADDLSFTAENGKRYMDVAHGCRFTPREVEPLQHTVTYRANPAPEGADGNMRSSTPVCSCGWEGFAVHAYNDDQYSRLAGQTRRHAREAELLVKGGSGARDLAVMAPAGA